MWKISSLYFRTFCLNWVDQIYLMHQLVKYLHFSPVWFLRSTIETNLCVSIDNCHYVIWESRFHFDTICRAVLVGLVGMSGKGSPFWWDPEFLFRKMSCIELLKLYMKKNFFFSIWIGFVRNGMNSVWVGIYW